MTINKPVIEALLGLLGVLIAAWLAWRAALQLQERQHARAERAARIMVTAELRANLSRFSEALKALEAIVIEPARINEEGQRVRRLPDLLQLHTRLSGIQAPVLTESALNASMHDLAYAYPELLRTTLLEQYEKMSRWAEGLSALLSRVPPVQPSGTLRMSMSLPAEMQQDQDSFLAMARFPAEISSLQEQGQVVMSQGERLLAELKASSHLGAQKNRDGG